MATNADRLGEALTKKGVKAECSVCGRNDWGGSGDSLVTLSGTTREGGPGAVQVLPMVCNYCGYVRLHSPTHLGI